MQWLSPILTLLSSLLGFGMLVGMVRTTVTELKDKTNHMHDCLEVQKSNVSDLREEVRVGFARIEERHAVAPHRVKTNGKKRRASNE